MLEKFAGNDTIALVVEDEETTRDLVTRLLTAMGAAEVLIAEEGSQALRLVCERHPHIVISDVEMKPVDGLALLGGIRGSMDPQVSSIPVVMFTSTQQGEVAKKAKELGVNGFLVKPFNPKGFSTHIRDVLEKKSFLIPPGSKK
ncbi:MAG: response regulator [Alphaproteobacteria bacterium]|nr:response regulator [Alphaproteobacteria bacterium]